MQDPPAYRDETTGDFREWSRAARGNPHVKPGQEVSQPAHRSVLIVDDDWAIRQSLRLMLEDEGYPVAEARDGVEALSALRASADPYVVLLDLMMPRMTGEQVLGTVERDSHLQGRLAFIIITADLGQVNRELRHRLATLRIPVLGKPLDIDDVLARVASAEQQLPPTP
ncbi:MAG TPA: response regulator [Ktedonobacterales bacterium]